MTAHPQMLRSHLLSLVCLVMAVGGCFKLARTSPPVERFVLGGAVLRQVPVDSSHVAADSERVAIGMRRVDLAPYVATLAIVVRRADNEIITSGFHRWAESPTAGVTRAVADYLAATPGVRSVDIAPWNIRAEQDFIVQLHIVHLEGVLKDSKGGEALVLARWEILRPRDGALLARGRTEHRAADWTANDYLGLAARLDDGLAVIARDLTDCIARLRTGARADSLPDRVVAVECRAR